eukprot:1008595-Amphidinium_carterae.1
MVQHLQQRRAQTHERYKKELAELESGWAPSIRTASEKAGISLSYVLRKFPAEVSNTGFLSVGTGSTFHELSKVLFQDPVSVGGDVECPRDGQKGASLVDFLAVAQQNHCSQATHFVSWCWRYTLAEVSSALQSWLDASSSEESEVFLWMCFFCNNQYRILDNTKSTGTDELKKVFEKNLTDIGKMIIIMDDFTQP